MLLEAITKGTYHLFSSRSYLLLMDSDPSTTVEFGRSDGTDAGTVILKGINAEGSDSSVATFFYFFDNLIYFFPIMEHIEMKSVKRMGLVLKLPVKGINPFVGSSATYEPFNGTWFSIFLWFHDFNGHTYFKATGGNSNGEI